ncbi:MucR family transcriptional regulator [uncultured Methylobacterium sp.]|uniref:MucR family transcriptional regulator n=1 Tax=uncultured Methylobacterium sp. TaxID=157278 RepID=UPI0035CAF986
MDGQTETQPINHIEITADIVSAYISNHSVPVSELPALLSRVHAALVGLGSPATAEASGPEKLTPAQMRKSITPDALISFLDGKPYKTLKRHLTTHGLTLEAYRARYGLPSDYPSTAASYSAQRSELARSLGLGQQRRKAIPNAVEVAETIDDTPKPRGRPRKTAETTVEAPKARGRKKVAELA